MGVWFNVLDVGQGTGNFIEIWGPAGVRGTVLIDLGSDKKALESPAGGPSLDYVVEVLRNMKPQPTLDGVLLSHGHADHVNLLNGLFKVFDPCVPGKAEGKPTLLIKKVRYGGYPEDYNGLLTTLKKYMNGGELRGFSPSETAFVKDEPAEHFMMVHGARFFCYMANASRPPRDASGPAAKKSRRDMNTDSLVVVVSFAGVQIVVTGDATGRTMARCNDVTDDDVINGYLNKVLMLTLPHHGSVNTALTLPGSSKDEKEENVRTFASKLRARAITISAEKDTTYKLPRAKAIEYFADSLPKSTTMFAEPGLGNRHFYTAYFETKNSYKRRRSDGWVESWPPSDAWYTVQTEKNIYTNLYYDRSCATQADTVFPPSPGIMEPVPAKVTTPPSQVPLGAAWAFGIEDNGSTWLQRMWNRASLLRLRAAINAGVKAADLPDVPTEDMPHPYEPGPAPAGLPASADGDAGGTAPRPEVTFLPPRPGRKTGLARKPRGLDVAR